MNKEEIIKKARMKIAISNFENENNTICKREWLKIVATFLIVIGVSGGIGYATGNVIYEKIWNEPKKFSYKEFTEEEKEKCISEEEAEKIGNSYLRKIGLEQENIQNSGLSKEFFEKEYIWRVSSQKTTIIIDAKTGKIKSVNIPTWNYKIPYNYGITKIEARKVAKQLLEKYKTEDDKGEYVLVELRRNMETDEASYIWYATFQKKYDNLLSECEQIRIGWVPTINGLYSLDLKREIYENNEEKITKEQAISIAKEKDITIEKEKKIENIKAEIRIKQMNENVYLREHYKEEYERGIFNYEKVGENQYKLKDDAVFYKTDGRVRKVWVVVIEYNPQENSMPSYTYYVDATTGEIIGGKCADELHSEEATKNDTHNFIEK